VGDDVDDIAVLISEEEPAHSPVLVREWMNDLQRGSNNTRMDRVDVGRGRHALHGADASLVITWSCTAGVSAEPRFPTQPRSMPTPSSKICAYSTLARATSATGRLGTIRVTPMTST